MLAACSSSSAALLERGKGAAAQVYVWGKLPKDSSTSSHHSSFSFTPQLLLRSDQVSSPVLSLHSSPSSALLVILHENGDQTYVPSMNKANLVEYNPVLDFQIPMQVQSSPKAKQVAIGCEHVLLLDYMGKVHSWGQGSFGVLGRGDFASTDTPMLIPNLELVEMIAAGAYHSLCGDAHGRLRAWGHGGQGRLGLGLPNEGVWEPTLIKTVTDCARVFCGDSHSAYLSKCGTKLYVWGNASFHRLGVGVECSQVSRPTLVDFFHGRSITQVSLGMLHGACVLDTGQLYMWGDGSNGKLGPSSNKRSKGEGEREYLTWSSPHLVELDTNVVAVSCGASHTLVKLASGKILAFGEAAWCGERNKLPPHVTARDCALKFFAKPLESAALLHLTSPTATTVLHDVDVTNLPQLLLLPGDESNRAFLTKNAFSSSKLRKQELRAICFALMRSNVAVSYTNLEADLQSLEALRAELLELICDKIPQVVFELERVERDVMYSTELYVDAVLLSSEDPSPGVVTANINPQGPQHGAELFKAFALLLGDPQRVFDFWNEDRLGRSYLLQALCRDLYDVSDFQSERLFHRTIQLVSRADLEAEFERRPDSSPSRRYLVERSVFLQLALAVYTPKLDFAQLHASFFAELARCGGNGGDASFDLDPLQIEAQLLEAELAKKLRQRQQRATPMARSSALEVVYLKPFQAASTSIGTGSYYDEEAATQAKRIALFQSSAKVRGILETRLANLKQMLKLISDALTGKLAYQLHAMFSTLYRDLRWTFLRRGEEEIRLAVMRTLFHFWFAPALTMSGYDRLLAIVDACFTKAEGEPKFNIPWFSNLETCANEFRARLIKDEFFPFAASAHGSFAVDEEQILPQFTASVYRDQALVIFPSPEIVELVRNGLKPSGVAAVGAASLGRRRITTAPMSAVNTKTGSVTVVIGHYIPLAQSVATIISNAAAVCEAEAIYNLEQWVRGQRVCLPSASIVRMHAAFLRAPDAAAAAAANKLDVQDMERLVENLVERTRCKAQAARMLADFAHVKTQLLALMARLEQEQQDLYDVYLPCISEENASQNPQRQDYARFEE